MTAPVVIVGAGVAGCVAARTLADRGADVVLLDAGPGPQRPAVLDGLDHLRSVEATNWWFEDEPPRGRGLGGGSSVNGMVLDAVHPLDMKRWGWDDALEHQRWLLDRWPSSTVSSAPFTEAFGRCVRKGFPSAARTTTSGWSGWAALSLAAEGGRRCSAADAFLAEDITVRSNVEVARLIGGAEPSVELATGESIKASVVLVAAGNAGSPALLERSGLIAARKISEPLNHPSTAVVVELDEQLRCGDGPVAPSSHMLRTVSGLTENTVDLQMLVLGHTGSDPNGRRHGVVVVSALEPDRQKVLVAGVTQALHWLGSMPGVRKVSLSEDPSPVQHQSCSLTAARLSIPGVQVIDASVLPALPHTNPMLSIAVGARRAALRIA